LDFRGRRWEEEWEEGWEKARGMGCGELLLPMGQS
jgi:hypothetical protein